MGLFVMAYHWESIFWLYIATGLQECVAGLYALSHSAIVAQLAQSDAQLNKATTLEGLTWSAMQAFGAAASGWMVGTMGIRTCFVVDGISYIISALLLGLSLARTKWRLKKEKSQIHMFQLAKATLQRRHFKNSIPW